MRKNSTKSVFRHLHSGLITSASKFPDYMRAFFMFNGGCGLGIVPFEASIGAFHSIYPRFLNHLCRKNERSLNLI